MSNQQTTPAGNFTYGFVAGGLVVGTLALLFAPKTGKKLRKQINKTLGKTSNDLLSTAGGYLSSAKEKANDLLNDGKDSFTSMLSMADNELKTMENKTTKLINEAKHKLGSVMDIDSQDKKTNHRNRRH